MIVECVIFYWTDLPLVLDTKKIIGGWYNILAVHASILLDAQMSVSLLLVRAYLNAECVTGTNRSK